MAEYRRFISYIYAYEGDMRTKNVGFAKIEARNGQCRISISIKGAYECSGGVLFLYGYGYKGAGCLLVPLGQIPVKNGTGEAVFGKQEENLGGSGYSLAFIKGLYLRSKNSVRKTYLTTWDDTAVHISALGNAEIAGEEVLKAAAVAEKPLTGMEAFRQVSEEPMQITFFSEERDAEKKEELGNHAEPVKEEKEKTGEKTEEEPAKEKTEGEIEKIKEEAQEEDRAEEETMKKEPEEPAEKAESSGRMPENFYFREGFLELPLWECLQKILPRKRALAEEGWEVLQIQIQDIGRLPRENWPYGNNSFVLHGYYQYRYLILARRKRKPEKRFQSGYQYILGVPGIFKPQEKFMASMFGLPEFKRAAGNRKEDFGFWCGSIQM